MHLRVTWPRELLLNSLNPKIRRTSLSSSLHSEEQIKKYVNGVLYMVDCRGNCYGVSDDHLPALDLERGTIDKVQLPILYKPDYYRLHLQTNR